MQWEEVIVVLSKTRPTVTLERANGVTVRAVFTALVYGAACYVVPIIMLRSLGAQTGPVDPNVARAIEYGGDILLGSLATAVLAVAAAFWYGLLRLPTAAKQQVRNEAFLGSAVTLFLLTFVFRYYINSQSDTLIAAYLRHEETYAWYTLPVLIIFGVLLGVAAAAALITAKGREKLPFRTIFGDISLVYGTTAALLVIANGINTLAFTRFPHLDFILADLIWTNALVLAVPAIFAVALPLAARHMALQRLRRP